MADDRLTEIAARVAAATPAPWCADDAEIYQGVEYVPDISQWIGETADIDNIVRSRANATFAAHAREDVPWLLVQLKQAQRTSCEFDEVTQERDAYHEAADALAYAVAPIEVIGEHSSGNCPWTNAVDLVTPAAEVFELRRQLEQARRIATELENENARLNAEASNKHVETLLKAADRLVLDLAPSGNAATSPGYLLGLKNTVTALRRMADEAVS